MFKNGLRIAFVVTVLFSFLSFLSLTKVLAGPPPNTIGANANILSLASLPTNDEVVYAGTPVGLFKSIDGGGNWSLVGLSGQKLTK